MINLTAQERDEGRKRVHGKELSFEDWLQEHDAVLDLDGLIPFTRWLTPPKIHKRYSTQMYLYFLPLDSTEMDPGMAQSKEMYIPTPDGGIEHTTAQFLYPQEWLDMSLRRDIALFPPQFTMLALIAPFLISNSSSNDASNQPTLLEQRNNLKAWVEHDGDPPWGEKCVSPDAIKFVKKEYILLGLAKPGPELEGTSRRGDDERVVKVLSEQEFEKGKQGPRPVKVILKKDIDMKTGRLVAKM